MDLTYWCSCIDKCDTPTPQLLHPSDRMSRGGGLFENRSVTLMIWLFCNEGANKEINRTHKDIAYPQW